MLASWQAAITDAAGNVVPIANIEVQREAGGLVQLFADRDGTMPLGNPFQVQGGYARFHALGGVYRIRAYAAGYERTWRYVAIGTAAEYDIGQLGIGANVDAQVANLAEREAFDDEPDGFRVLVSDTGDGRAAIYSRFGDPGEWIGPAYVTGAQGIDGESGWAPVFAIVSDGTRRVQQVVDWIGGTSIKPETGFYVGADGFVEQIEFAVDIRGAPGPAGDGSGDMLASVYDPTDKVADAFSMANMVEATDALILTGAERSIIAGTPSQITTLNSSVSSLQSDVSGLESGVTALDARVDNVEAEIAALGSDYEFISAGQVDSAVSTVNITGLGGYASLVVMFNNLVLSSSANLLIQTSSDNGSSYDGGSNYAYATGLFVSTSVASSGSNSTTALLLANNLGTSAAAGKIVFPGDCRATIQQRVLSDIAGTNGSGNFSRWLCGGGRTSAIVNALRLVPNSGTINQIRYRAYGVKAP